ncbi:MAG TPA: hypothetical protein VMH39_12795 [Gemmatimonadaceae bacterium]|nr:hypothetical protein [Gemmatimonadaceae bacterium]
MPPRLRAVLGTALTWGAVWSLGAFATVANWRVLAHFNASTALLLLRTMRDLGLRGALAGTIFAVLLHYAARRTGSIDALSIRRTARWGALGGLAVVALTIPQHVIGPGMILALGLGAAVGAASGAGSLLLARRATVGLRRAQPE